MPTIRSINPTTAREIAAFEEDTDDAVEQKLAENGIVVRPSRGFNVWVPVRSEPDALVYLAAQGIGVAPGSAFTVGEQKPHIRVSTAALTGDTVAISAQIATATRVGRAKG